MKKITRQISHLKKKRKLKLFVELSRIMLKEAGAAACMKGCGTADPEWVGRYALQFCDIRPDGGLN